MQAFRYAATIFMAVAMLLLLTGCNEITNLPLGNDTIVEYEVDEFGTPSYRWRWRYGLVSGELEVTSSEGWNTEIDDDYGWGKLPRIYPVFGMQDGENEMVVNSETTNLRGGGYWEYLQIRVNGELVRHRWPQADVGTISVELGFIGYRTEMFDLNMGRNEVILTAIWQNNFVSKTIYLIRNE